MRNAKSAALPRLFFALVGATALSGCAGPARSAPPPNAHAATAPRSTPTLRGTANFFDGRLLAVATVGRGRAGGSADASPGDIRRGERSRRPRPQGGDASRTDSPPAERGSGRGGRTTLHAASQPPITLRLQLTNNSPASLEVLIREVASELGNFAVRPERLTLAPHQTGEVDPMVSQLGAPTAGLPLTITLRVSGQTETQVIPLDSVATAREGQ